MSNSTALIANITTIEQAATAFGYKLIGEEWVRASKDSIKTIEGKFGLLKKMYLDDTMEAHDGSHRIVMYFDQQGKERVRYLSRVDVAFSDVSFPTDHRAAKELDQYLDDSDGMVVTHVPGTEWMCFETTVGRVTGFVAGSFTTVFERFINSTTIDLELSYRRFLTDLGPATIKDLHEQAVQVLKKRAAKLRKTAEARIQKQIAEFNESMSFLHDCLEMGAEMDDTQPKNVATTEGIEYRCVYMQDHDSKAAEQSGPVATNWPGFVAAHAKSKRLGELAWAYRTVNKHKVPYAIWNPSATLWELL